MKDALNHRISLDALSALPLLFHCLCDLGDVALAAVHDSVSEELLLPGSLYELLVYRLLVHVDVEAVERQLRGEFVVQDDVERTEEAQRAEGPHVRSRLRVRFEVVDSVQEPFHVARGDRSVRRVDIQGADGVLVQDDVGEGLF